jgi:hypothetical protein
VDEGDLQIAVGELAEGDKRLRSRSEVEGFRVEREHRLLVETFAARVASQLVDQHGVGAAVGRPDQDVDAAGKPFP